jgi:hypothetical protein
MGGSIAPKGKAVTRAQRGARDAAEMLGNGPAGLAPIASTAAVPNPTVL